MTLRKSVRLLEKRGCETSRGQEIQDERTSSGLFLNQVCQWLSNGFYFPFIFQMVPACLAYLVYTEIS